MNIYVYIYHIIEVMEIILTDDYNQQSNVYSQEGKLLLCGSILP